MVGRQRGGVPRRARHVPRPGGLLLVPRGAAGEGRPAARRPDRPTRARGGRRCGAVRALARRRGRRRRRDGRVRRDARGGRPLRRRDGTRDAPGPGGRPRAAVRRRLVRRRLHGVRRAPVRPGRRPRARGGRAGPAAGRPVGVRGDAPRALGVPRRPRRGGSDRDALVLRPDALRRARRVGRRPVRRVPPDPRRPRRRAGRRRVRPRPARRARVARRATTGPGAGGGPCAVPGCRGRRSS